MNKTSKKFADMTPLELFHCEQEWAIERLVENLAKWKAQFEEDPLYALEWSDRSFEWAAELYVRKLLRLTVEKAGLEEGLKEFKQRALEEALRSAKYPSRSTSACTNQANLCKGSAWAKVHEELEKRKQ